MWKTVVLLVVLTVLQESWCGIFDFSEFDDPYLQNFFINRPATIIRQHHGRCTTNLDGINQEGVCLTRPECSLSGGRSQGRQSCLLGTCCLYTRGCNRRTNNRVSYFEGTNNNNNNNLNDCTYSVRVENSNICQMRLDFDSLDFPEPTRQQFTDSDGTVTSTGPYTCRDALFRVVSPNDGTIPILCGRNSGQHIYVPVNASRGERELLLKVDNIFVTTGNGNSNPTVNSVSWKIKITQLECPNFSKHQNSIRIWEDSHVIAPSGCLQYNTAPSDTIRNLGYGSGTSGVANNHYDSNLNYAICFRRTPDMCGIDFNVNAFTVTGTGSPCIFTDISNDPNGIIQDADYLYVPNGLLTNVEFPLGVKQGRYCGTINANSRIRSVTPGPFYIFFKTDNQFGTGADSTSDNEIGWEMDYATIFGNNCG